jgi:hypothetical protein
MCWCIFVTSLNKRLSYYSASTGCYSYLYYDYYCLLYCTDESINELFVCFTRNYPGNLPHFSERISNAINACKDAIVEHMAKFSPGDKEFDELLPLVKDSLPKKLQTVAWDRALARLPVQYMRSAMASTLGARLVYQEGIHLIETQPREKLAERAIMYYRASQQV